MALPSPDLDDRTFQDIVDEAKRLIPEYCPDVDEPQPVRPRRRAHRAVRVDDRDGAVPAQPGARPAVRQVPRPGRHRAVPAQPGPAPTSRSGCRRPATRPSSSPPAPRWARPPGPSTAAPSCSPPTTTCGSSQPELTGFLTGDRTGPLPRRVGRPQFGRERRPRASPRAPAAGRRLLPRLRRPARRQHPPARPGRRRSRGSGVDPRTPPLDWEAWTGNGWDGARVLDDDTRAGSTGTATITLLLPAGARAAHAGRPAGVLGAGPPRPARGRGGRPTVTSPRIRARWRRRASGGTVTAHHGEPAPPETLGYSDGLPGQLFTVRHRPVLPRRAGRERWS